MSGTRIVCTDLDTGEQEERVIENDYAIITDGNRYVAHVQTHASGTVVITIKRRRAGLHGATAPGEES